MQDLNNKLNTHFSGKVVRKDLSKKIKEGANVPVYVLEYLLGMYCATEDEEAIKEGVIRVKKILSKNFVRPDEAEKIKSKIKELGHYTVIDKITVKLNAKKDIYEAIFSNLGLSHIFISGNYVRKFEKLLAGGIWCILDMSYTFDEEIKESPFIIEKLKPIQIANMDLEVIFKGRKNFTKEEWMDVLVRSSGLEPTQFEEDVKWHIIERLVPLVENNYNLCELGPRGTGKSYVYKEISPNSILISGGQSTVANLFYNMNTKQVGLVGMWDTVAFDEVAGMRFKDKDGIQIMKDFMSSGSFARGREEKSANASMVFVGNINESIESILKSSHLFSPFPESISYDTAFFDRMHFYLPGWEIPKMRPEFITDEYGFIVDYLAEFLREMRKYSYTDAIDEYFSYGNNLNQRDVIAVRKTISGLIKLVYPNGLYTKEQLEEIVKYALIGRRRVKEQLKKIGGMEFHDVHFSYIDKEDMNEKYVSVPEQGGSNLIPEGMPKPGHIYTVNRSPETGLPGVYKIETMHMSGSGQYEVSGISGKRDVKESIKTAYNYFKANSSQISGSIKLNNKKYLIDVNDLKGVGLTTELSLAAFIGLCSSALQKPIKSQMVVLGSMTVGGTIKKVINLTEIMQATLDAGGKKLLLPMVSSADFAQVPPEIISQFQIIFYNTPIDAIYKALGVD